MSSDADFLFHHDLSNDEIRRRLTNDFNVECGPVTPSTRRVLLKKLAKLEQEKNGLPDDINNQNILSGDSISQVNETIISNGKNEDSHEHLEVEDLNESVSSHNRSQRLQSPRRYSPRRKVNDEMKDAIKSFNEIKKLKKKTSKENDSPKKVKTNRKSIVSNISLIDPPPKNLNEYSSESSDNDDNEVKTFESISSNIFSGSRIASPRIFNGEQFKPTLTRAPIRRSTVEKNMNISTLLNYSDSESEVEDIKRDKICKMLLSHRPGLGRGSKNNSKISLFSKIASFFQNIKRKLTFSQGEPANFSSSSNYISLALLIFVVFFFVIIFSVYLYAKFTFNSKHTLDLNDYTFIEDKNKLVAPICKNSESMSLNCLQFESDRKPALNIIREIKSYIDKFIYETYCGSSDSTPDFTALTFKKSDLQKNIGNNINLLTEERDPSLKSIDSSQLLDYDFYNAFKLIKQNPSWNFKLNDDAFNSEISLLANYTLNLPIQCQFKLFVRDNFWTILSSFLVSLLSVLSFFYFRYAKRVASQEQDQVYDLIEKSIELLQSPDEPQSMPVLHIRDTLLSPSERKSTKYRRIWNKVVAHMENSESRVKVEFKKIDGEDFKAWKWIANTGTQYLTDNENDVDASMTAGAQTQKIGGVEWQGQAFVLGTKSASANTENENADLISNVSQDIYRNKSFQALTRFLKIRNIFEKEAQYLDPNWTKKIKNTILEKTAAASENGCHDIVHIEIEDSANEGLVYLKCASIPGATNAFHTLHGWWCEKKLVSVKFLKEERYYQRFPHARNMNSTLQIEPLN